MTQTLIDQISETRAAGATSLRMAWQSALESLPALPDTLLAQIGPALPSPDATRHLARFLAREADPPAAVEQFLQEVDDSDESLDEWMLAFEVMAYFLDSTPHRPGLTQALGYLHCCAAVAHSGARYATFPLTVETMLETYGYAGEDQAGTV
jgi:hypothetical protein